MLFNSLQFAIFFPVAALIYFVIPKKMRCLWLLLASYVFYMSASPKYVVFLLFPRWSPTLAAYWWSGRKRKRRNFIWG